MFLLSANGGTFFKNECLPKKFNYMRCDVRLKECGEELLPETKVILCLGFSAVIQLIGDQIGEATLNEIRGHVYEYKGIPVVPSYHYQDAVDMQAYEQRHNDKAGVLTESGKADTDQDAKRRHGKTKRSNFSFWLKKDTQKAIRILQHGIPEELKPEYIIDPDYRTFCNTLRKQEGTYFYFDIETDFDHNITVFSCAIDSGPVYCVPMLSHNYYPAGPHRWEIYQALSTAIRRLTVVSHNGACFDWPICAVKYGLAVNKVYDTMIATHRCFPEVEKSLGHCTSLWTYEKYHKDESDFSMRSAEAVDRLLSYCGKDIHTMRLVHKGIEAYAKTIPGQSESINRAMDYIEPYMYTLLIGMHYDEDIMSKRIHNNDKLMMQYLRIIEILIGKDWMKQVRGTGGSGFPNSNKQCVEYFHNVCGYDVVSRTDTGRPSLAEDALFKLKLKYDNPVIDVCLAYRRLSKETGSLKFIPWKGELTKPSED